MNDQDMQQLAAALGRIPSGLFVLTATDGTRTTGVLVSWVQQCSFDPPRVTVCVRQGRDLLDWLGVGSAFTINLLGQGQKHFIGHFGKGFSLHEDAFAGLNVERPDGEAPILTDALGHLRCRVAGASAEATTSC